jgi:predicted NAD/FAD-dependent oxidoreductase
MKQTRLMKILATGMACVVAATAFAQTSSTTTTTNAGGTAVSTSTKDLSGAGTITAYTPGSDYITFRSETTTTPVKYYYTKKTVLVDPNGKVVEWTALRPDMPVTYTYVKEGDRMVVTRVTLAKPVEVYKKEETTTTTTTTKP